MSISPLDYLRHILDEVRDRLIHDYFGVDYDIVWDVATNKAATVGRDIEAILQDRKS